MPGTRAWRRPNDPGPIEPFSISVQDDVIYLELVVYCNGGIKRVHRLAVRGGAALPLVADLGGDEAGGNECQGEGEGTELEQDRCDTPWAARRIVLQICRRVSRHGDTPGTPNLPSL